MTTSFDFLLWHAAESEAGQHSSEEEAGTHEAGEHARDESHEGSVYEDGTDGSKSHDAGRHTGLSTAQPRTCLTCISVLT